MKFMAFAFLVYSALIASLTGCSKDNAVVNPNTNSQPPLFSFTGYTTSSSFSAAAKVKNANWNQPDPATFVRESKNPKLAMVWLGEADKGILDIFSPTKEWPLKFKADFFNIPNKAGAIPVPGHPESWFYVGFTFLFNDANNNNKLDYDLDHYYALSSY